MLHFLLITVHFSTAGQVSLNGTRTTPAKRESALLKQRCQVASTNSPIAPQALRCRRSTAPAQRYRLADFVDALPMSWSGLPKKLSTSRNMWQNDTSYISISHLMLLTTELASEKASRAVCVGLEIRVVSGIKTWMHAQLEGCRFWFALILSKILAFDHVNVLSQLENLKHPELWLTKCWCHYKPGRQRELMYLCPQKRPCNWWGLGVDIEWWISYWFMW